MREYHAKHGDEPQQIFEPEPPLEPLVTPSSTSPKRRVTAQDLDAFSQDPSQLVGKQFIHESHGYDIVLYEVVGHGFSKRKGKWYEVQFEHDLNSIEMGASEMAKMLKDSFVLEA